MELVFLGTSSAIPSKTRNHPSIALKAFGEVILFDCGEGTQRQLAIAKISPMKINKIFISHLHGDHVLGLPGLVQSMDFRDRTEPLDIYGPKGLKQLRSAIFNLGYCSINFEIRIHEINVNMDSPRVSYLDDNIDINSNNCCDDEVNNIKSVDDYNDCNCDTNNLIIDNDEYSIEYMKAEHNVCNFSYSFVEKKKPKFLKDKAIELGVKPGPDFKKLHNGFEIKVGGKTVKSEEVLGDERIGVKIVYSGDTKHNENLINFSKNADFLIHESTYSEIDKDKAIENYHSTSKQAALIAKQANVKNLILTHISVRYKNTEDLKNEAISIFKNTKVAYGFMSLNF